MPTAAWSSLGHFPGGPRSVPDQSKARIRPAISLTPGKTHALSRVTAKSPLLPRRTGRTPAATGIKNLTPWCLLDAKSFETTGGIFQWDILTDRSKRLCFPRGPSG